MLNRSQIHTLLLAREREGNLFSNLPVELIRKISEFGQNPSSEFATALKHVARGELLETKTILAEASTKEDKTKLKEFLLSSGTAITRCGLTVMHKTLLECALGEGDREMIKMIKSYFPMFDGGEKEMEKQLERYRPCIEAMQNQQPEDLTWLFNIIKKSSAKDVLAELLEGDEYDASYQSELRTALNKFREQKLDPKVRVITKPRMHCNYQNLDHANAMLDSNCSELTEWDDNQGYNYDKCYLVARQVIGFIQLVELPAYERYLFARNQVVPEAAGKKIEIERTVNYKSSSGSFPDFDASLIKSHSGFGFVTYARIYGVGAIASFDCQGSLWGRMSMVGHAEFTKLISAKNFRLAELMPCNPKPKTSSRCVIA